MQKRSFHELMAGYSHTSTSPSELAKEASEAGVNEGAQLLKIATHLGGAVGQAVESHLDGMVEELTTKIAHLVLHKLATLEDEEGNLGYVNEEAKDAALEEQVVRKGDHAAYIAMTAAGEANDALDRGDSLAAAQNLATAANNLEQAMDTVEALPDREDLRDVVQEAAGVVHEVASKLASAQEEEDDEEGEGEDEEDDDEE